MGVPITGTITPTDPIDIYATTDPLTGIDSWRSVADHTERNAITALRRRQGMAVWTQNDGFLWTLNAAPWAFDDTDWTQFSGGGGSAAGLKSQVQINLDGTAFGAIGGLGGTTDSVPLGSGSVALGEQSFAQGFQSQATTDQSVAIGYQCVAGDPPRACTISGATVTFTGIDLTNWFFDDGPGTFVASNLSGGTGPTIAYGQVLGDPVFTGGDTVVTLVATITTHTAGFANIRDDNTAAYAEGHNSAASGFASHAEGRSTTASGTSTHAEGFQTIASANDCHAEGESTTASGAASHAEGISSVASASASHAEGFTGLASANYAHAEGQNSTASGVASHAEGNGTIASADDSHAEGSATVANGIASHAEGQSSTATGKISHAAGLDALADLQAKIAWGGGQFAALGDCQSTLLTLSAVTTDATPVLLQVQDTPSSVLIRNGVAYGFRATIIGRKTDGSSVAMFMRSGIIQNLSGTTAMVGDVSSIGADNNVPSWAITITANNGASSLEIRVTGTVATTVRWVCTLEAAEVG